MKKIIPIILTLNTAGAVFASFVINNAKQVVSAYGTASLPTTIDLNDCSSEEIKAYYSKLDSLETTEKQGNNLLKNLKEILKNGQKYYSYDTDSNGRKIWQIYEIADRDWEKSPATELSGYNATTNTITGYSYGTSASKSGTNPYVHALYVDRSVDNKMHAWALEGTTTSSHGDNKEWGIDREHIWPKSQGFEEEGAGGARGDPMHLWPGDSDVNSSIHNNWLYGFVNRNSVDKVGKWSYAKENYLGKSLTLNKGNVFEPQDSDKGDIARAIFYMVARYNYLSGSDSDGIDKDNPNLELIQGNDVLASYTSTTANTGKMGILTDLLEWHHLDPVDEFEIHRNNLLYKNFTNNRNPFIDYPQWVDYVWGKATYEGSKYVSYNETPTGYVDLNKDVINGYNAQTEELVISETSAELLVGDEFKISASSIDGSDITWTTSDSTVIELSKSTSASKENITVTAKGEGNAIVTAKVVIEGEEFTKECDVLVEVRSIENIRKREVKKVQDYYNSLNLDKYDKKGKEELQKILNDAIASINNSNSEDEIKTIVNDAINSLKAVKEKSSDQGSIIPQFTNQQLIIIIAVAVVLIVLAIILIIVFSKANKKQKKKMIKTAKKVVKGASKNKRK